ncbi:hypothetical protein BDZ89DRAFT_1144434 [Hymenopellis radicata]|nr:hypothetical protein BDZ89DRAFT_1144434 [Hymenopellis radicata]
MFEHIVATTWRTIHFYFIKFQHDIDRTRKDWLIIVVLITSTLCFLASRRKTTVVFATQSSTGVVLFCYIGLYCIPQGRQHRALHAYWWYGFFVSNHDLGTSLRRSLGCSLNRRCSKPRLLRGIPDPATIIDRLADWKQHNLQCGKPLDASLVLDNVYVQGSERIIDGRPDIAPCPPGHRRSPHVIRLMEDLETCPLKDYLAEFTALDFVSAALDEVPGAAVFMHMRNILFTSTGPGAEGALMYVYRVLQNFSDERRLQQQLQQRFYTAANNPALSAKKSRLMEDNEGKRDGKVTESMDCFSVGCVIAELFLEGAPLFTLSQLFKFRESEYSVDSALSNIEDEGIRNLIKQMISLDPSARPTFDTLLHTSRGTVFPESFFSFLHNYVTSVNDLPVESPFKDMGALMSATLGFLYHPNVWVRQGVASFIASAAKHLPESDVWCIVYPSLRHFLRSDISTIDEQSLLAAMKPPVPRQIFDTAVQWAMRADKSAFWKGAHRSNKDTPRESIMSLRKSTSAMPKSRSDDDEAQIVKLQQLGMTQSDEAKLLAMRDYITKLANAISSFASRLSCDPETEVNLKTIANRLPQISRCHGSPGGLRSLPSKKSTPLMSPVSNSSLHRISSAEFGSPGAPFEDLRRRLATINGSASSLSLAQSPREPRATLSPLIPPSSSSTSSMAGPMAMTPTTGDRPGSPSESVISTTNSSNFRPPSRLHVGMDGQKAAPAVGSFKTNVARLLDSHTKMRSDGSPERSGRSSPIAMSATIRSPQAVHSHHNPNMLQVSSYDGQEPAISNLLENLYLDNNREL